MKIVSDKMPKVDVESILTTEEIAAIHEFMHHYPQARAASLDALKIVQKRNGWVDDAQANAAGVLCHMAFDSTFNHVAIEAGAAPLRRPKKKK